MSPKISPKCWAIVPAAGIGSRMQSTIPKQYLQLAGRPLIEHCLQTILAADWIEGIVVAVAEEDNYWQSLKISKNAKIKTVIGGNERVDTVYKSVMSIQPQLQHNDFILVHDAARPCFDKSDLEQLHQELYFSEQPVDTGFILADRLTDTIKRDDGSGSVLKTVPREGLWRALTPQVFRNDILVKALQTAKQSSSTGITDEASAVEAIGLSPGLIQGRSDNIKVTNAGDIQLATIILQAQSSQGEQSSCE